MMPSTRPRKCNERRPGCKTRNLLALVAVAALGACAPKAEAPVSAPPIAGGWQAADPQGERVRAAAQFAAANLPQGHGSLAEVASASTQVVAGTNYRLTLRMADGTRWNATVWHRLDGTHVLTEAAPIP